MVRNEIKTRFSYSKPKMVKALNLVLILILLAGLGIVMVFPFAWMVLGSFKAESEMFAEGAITWLPQQWILDNYRHAFKELDFPIYFRNTIIYAGVVAFLQIVLSSLGGYAYARLRFPGRDFFIHVSSRHNDDSVPLQNNPCFYYAQKLAARRR